MSIVAEKPRFYTELLGLEEQTTLTLIKNVEAGLSFSAFEVFQRVIGLPANQLAASIVLSPSSLARNKKSGHLSSAQSERLVRLARLMEAAIELFEGDEAAARQWMKSPRAVLGDKTPLEMASTEIGAREVENLIMRLEDGVFS